MIDINELVCEQCTAVVDSLPSRKTALRKLAEMLALRCDSLSYRDIFFALDEREQQASTVLDDYPIAIPHCRLAGCDTLTAAVLKTKHEHGIDFSGQEVRFLFGLCIPESATKEALEVLRLFVQVVDNPIRREQLLVAETDEELFRSVCDGLAEVTSI